MKATHTEKVRCGEHGVGHSEGSADASQLQVHQAGKRVVRLEAELRAEISLKFWGGGGFEENGVRMTRANKR